MIGKIVTYFTSSYEEMRKVIWPNRREVTSHTIIVIASIAVSMAIIALIDFGLFRLLELLIYRGY
ncbi:MAG: Preprotein translocase subunit SecE, preprotein translocase subunit SecE [Candidatus Berkelbacteria bacterium]|nr:Preprotein translocase subunit SecE, preprotein translocase subunit SecE [Candidatus Berkelbacteria bacterium]